MSMEQQLVFDFSSFLEEVNARLSEGKSESSQSTPSIYEQIKEQEGAIETSFFTFQPQMENNIASIEQEKLDEEIESIDPHHLTNGYIELSIEMLRIAARDIVLGDSMPDNAERQENKKSAISWLKGESESALPFITCVEMLDVGLQSQSLGDFKIPDMVEKAPMLSEWILNNPKDAAYYLKNYKTLFDPNSPYKTETENNYNEFKEKLGRARYG